jgi:glycosyltransferase involved in cell wall biosynthesis
LKLGICIPTYNRSFELKNCLNSIYNSYTKFKKLKFEICISDNGSKEKNINTIRTFNKKFKNKVKIKYFRFKNNKGVAPNILKSISMSKADFVWAIGDDDLLMPDAFKKLYDLFEKKKEIDYFFINSYNLKLNSDKKKIINTNILSKKKLKPFSAIKKNFETNFFNLIDPKVSYDYLMAIYFSVFKKKKWDENINILDKKQIRNKNWMSNFWNTCINQIIFAEAFKNSRVYFYSRPLSINTSHSRDWSSLYWFLEIVRYPEILEYYRKKGLGFFRYIYCKNYSLRNFANYHLKIFINRKNNSGWQYIKIYEHIISNLIYPNAILSIFYFLYRKLFNAKKK